MDETDKILESVYGKLEPDKKLNDFESALDYDIYLRELISCPPDMSLVNYLKGLVYLYEQTENFVISSETVDEFCVRVSNVFVNDVKKKIDHDSLSRAMSDS